MRTSLLYLLLLMLPFAGLAQERKMTTDEVAVFQKKIKNTAQVTSLAADFVQYKHMSFMKKPVESSGKIFLKQPNKLSWSYVSPYAYKTIFKDNKIYIDDQGKKKTLDVGSSKQFEKMSKLIANSMQGQVYDQKEFAVSYFKKGSADLLKLVPKQADAKKYIKEIVLTFSSKDDQVEEVVLVEPSNDYTRFVLKNRKINAQINDSVFSL